MHCTDLSIACGFKSILVIEDYRHCLWCICEEKMRLACLAIYMACICVIFFRKFVITVSPWL